MPRASRFSGAPKRLIKRKFYRRGGKYAGYKRVPPAIKKYVKKAIHNNLENKVFISYGSNLGLNCIGNGTNVPNALYLLPNITQGTGHNLRVGNEIKIRSGVVRGHINLLPYNSTSNPLSSPVFCKMWLCSFKNINTSNILNCPTANFFETGQYSAGFQGNMLDMILTNDKDIVTIYRTKKFELGATYASSTGPVGTAGYFDNSKMSLPFYFSYGKLFKSSLKYNDTDTNIPTNRNLFLITQVVYADGSSTAITPAEMQYCIRVEYEDA